MELSGAYAYFPNRLQVLETLKVPSVNAELDLAADRCPALERAVHRRKRPDESVQEAVAPGLHQG